MYLAKALKEEREKHGYSMKQFCKLIGVPLSVYHGWENGVVPKLTEKTYGYLKKIKEHYALSWDYLFWGSDSALKLIKASYFLSDFIKSQNTPE